jgi:hypothetical protein
MLVSENSFRERERPEYVMAHSLAHALMSEVAIDCGYPASALKERIYVLPRAPGKPIHCGILIYTATAGNQGTLGGLVEVTRRFVRILKSALERERLCSGDPVCADHDPVTLMKTERYMAQRATAAFGRGDELRSKESLFGSCADRGHGGADRGGLILRGPSPSVLPRRARSHAPSGP